MNAYFFILGRNPSLSLAEIFAYFKKQNILTHSVFLAREFFIIETEAEIGSKLLIDQLGGIIKTGSIFGQNNSEEIDVRDFKISQEEILKHGQFDREKKNAIGFSLYQEESKGYSSRKKRLENHFIGIKKELKEKGFKARLVTSRERTLSSVVVKKNKMLEKGAEFCIFHTRNKIFTGQTQAVQDFESFSFRDYKRPCRDMEIGLIPPKLARILLNLSQAKEEETILDPFCGCGTVLQEAIILGFKNIIGSDISLVAIHNSRKNLEWLMKQYNMNHNDLDLKILHYDARKIEENLGPDSVDAIITEPYLGPPISLKIRERRIAGIGQKVAKLYLAFFQTIKRILKSNSRIVIVWPIFRMNSDLVFLPILEEVLSLGYEKENLIPEEFSKYSFINITKRGSIVYSRSDQKVLREIFVFRNV